MAKQVETAPIAQDVVANSTPQSRNLYASVNTFDAQGKSVGTRVVDMYHYGTSNWLSKHMWWAMHNGFCVETNIATDEEVGAYMASQELALQAKFGAPKGVVAAA